MLFQCKDCLGVVEASDDDFGALVACGHCESRCLVPSGYFEKSAVIDDFVVDGLIGEGAMGRVYKAHQLSLDRPVALKILREEIAENEEIVVGFLKEARAAAGFNHPNLVQAYAVGAKDNICFLAMEYIQGETLAQKLLRQGTIHETELIKIACNVASALSKAWKKKQLIHRDIKPDNIMIDDEGEVKLMDLGLACAVHELASEDGDSLKGTPHYMCPEQILGKRMDLRGDLYCLGASMYVMLTGQFLFEGDSAREILMSHVNDKPEPIRALNPALSQGMWYIVEKLLQKDPVDRYQSAEELIDALRQLELALQIKSFKTVGMDLDELEALEKAQAERNLQGLGTLWVKDRQVGESEQISDSLTSVVKSKRAGQGSKSGEKKSSKTSKNKNTRKTDPSIRTEASKSTSKNKRSCDTSKNRRAGHASRGVSSSQSSKQKRASDTSKNRSNKSKAKRPPTRSSAEPAISNKTLVLSVVGVVLIGLTVVGILLVN
jgi:serine/threonine protein kinase